MLVSGEVTAGQAFNLEAQLAQPFLRKVDLPVFKGILVAAAYKERELTAVSLEEAAEVEAVALRFVISHEARSRGEVEHAIVAVQGAVQLADLVFGYVIALGPHLPYSWHSLEQREGSAQAPAGPVGETA